MTKELFVVFNLLPIELKNSARFRSLQKTCGLILKTKLNITLVSHTDAILVFHFEDDFLVAFQNSFLIPTLTCSFLSDPLK